MSTTIRRIPGAPGTQAVAVCNASRRDALRLRAGLIFHADATTAISVDDIATGSSLVLQVAFTAAVSAAYVEHIASACDATTGLGAHMAADATNVFTTPEGTTLATCYDRMNEAKALFNLHGASAVFHPLADTLNVISATDATTAATLATLGNQAKAKINAHVAAAMAAQATIIGPA